jgi:hypothetical protein
MEASNLGRMGILSKCVLGCVERWNPANLGDGAPQVSASWGVWIDGSQQPWKKRHPEPVRLGVCGEMEARDRIHQIVETSPDWDSLIWVSVILLVNNMSGREQSG